ncbi:MAG: hypothetical protein ABWY63_14365 [Hyphomicrobiaceae bacterium]
MPDPKSLRDITATLADHEQRITALEGGDTSGGGDRPDWNPDIDPIPPEPEGDVAFEWQWGGRLDEFNLILEPQAGGRNGRTGTVEQQSGFVRATCYRQEGDDTPKACGEKKVGYQPREGQTISVDLDIELHECRSGAEIFLLDCETSTSSSSGTRLKLTDDFLWRADGGKLGFDSRNDDKGRRGSQYEVPRGRRVKVTVNILLDEGDEGKIQVQHDGQEVCLIEDIPTMRGTPSKFQCLLTAYGASENDEVVLDTHSVTYRVLD